jgi:hypothetical protein
MHPSVSEGTGTFEFNLGYFVGVTVETFTLTHIAGVERYYLMHGGTSLFTITIDDIETIHTGTLIDVAAGYYLLQLGLRNAEGAFAGKVEVVHIYRNMVTRTNLADYTFTAEDFDLIHTSFTVSNETEWNNVLSRIRGGGDNRTYTINVDASFLIPAVGTHTMTFGDVSGLNVIINGNQTLTLTGNGSLLRIGANQSVVMNDLKLVGHRSNSTPLVAVLGTFTMQGFASVSGNSTGSFDGGGVFVGWGSVFTMQDNSSVFGNHANSGGGVNSRGTFTMYDNASIHRNDARSNGGGVQITGGFFTMRNNSSIFANTAFSRGGGVDAGSMFTDDTFIMREEASIYGNTAGFGGGIALGQYTFRIAGGTVYGNEAVGDIRGVERRNIARSEGSSLFVQSLVIATYGGNNGDANSFGMAPFSINSTITQAGDSNPLNSIAGLANKLAWLNTNAQSNTSYILEINANESITPHTLSFAGRSNVTITLRGVGANRVINLTSIGSMFTVENGVSLILDNNITLQGHNSNNASLVRVNWGGRLTMNTGSRISDNRIIHESSGFGSGVGVNGFGTFIMNGGSITGNRAPEGGGVYVNVDGIFTINDGSVSNNTAFFGSAGGVMVHGTFNMNGGSIFGNRANYTGGGVSVHWDGAIFTKTGGIITGWASDQVNGNVVRNADGLVLNSVGHAVFVYINQTVKSREYTAWSSDIMDSRIPGIQGGWEMVRVLNEPVNLAIIPDFVYPQGRSARTISLTWDEVFGATGYRVYLRENNNYRPIGYTYDTMYVAGVLDPNTTYDFRVAAFNSFGEGPLSTSVLGRTLEDNTYIAIAQSPNRIIVEWGKMPIGVLITAGFTNVVTSLPLISIPFTNTRFGFIVERRNISLNGDWEIVDTIPVPVIPVLNIPLGHPRNYLVDYVMSPDTWFEYKVSFEGVFGISFNGPPLYREVEEILLDPVKTPSIWQTP